MTTNNAATGLVELTGIYTLDPAHTRIGFVARHAMVTKVRGAFNEFEGTAVLDGANPANSTATLTIKAASIDTRNTQRDEHLRSNDFLAMETYPESTFVSTAVRQTGETSFEVTGNLTINRKDYGITWNAALETGGVLVSDKIVLEFEVSAVKNHGNRIFDIEFDLVNHELSVRCSDGGTRSVPLEPKPVADFYAETMAALHDLHMDVTIRTTPTEVERAIPFEQDREHTAYDPDAAHLFWRQLIQATGS